MGVRAALASALLFGAGTPLAKLLLGDVSPWLLAGLLYLGSGLGLGVFRLVTRASRVRLDADARLPLAGAVAFGGCLLYTSCRITLEFRALPSVEDAVVLDELRDFCSALEQRMKAENAASSVVMEVAASTVGLDVPADAEVVQLGVAWGLESTPDKVTYGTEAGVYTAGGIPCVVLSLIHI